MIMCRYIIIGLICCAVQGCQTTGSSSSSPGSDKAAQAPTNAVVVAYIAGQPVTDRDLFNSLAEAAGGEILAETVVDQLIARELESRGLKLSPGAIQAEEALLLKSLSTDENQAVRLLRELREQRGLGKTRYAALLKRNAGLRLLVQPEVRVTEPAVRQAYQLAYGPRYQIRLLTVSRFEQAVNLLNQAKQGADFTTLIITHSTDSSRAQGGLLSPISPADPTYPVALRDAVKQLKPGQYTDPIALDGGFAIARLEKIIPAANITFEQAQESLSAQVRQRIERSFMEQKARELMQTAKVIVLNDALSQGWERQKEASKVK